MSPGFSDVFSNLLEEFRNGFEVAPFEDRVDIRFYTDPAWFEKEKAALFIDQPILVGHISMLKKNGDVFTHDHLGKPIMVARAKDGEIHAFLNVCRHRGVRLVNSEETINKTIVVFKGEQCRDPMEG
jgi:Rieske 2Fe-2S family protein